MSKRIDAVSRLIPAPPSVVYAAFAEASAMERWLPPKNMTATMLQFDFREGGGYRLRLTYRDLADGHGKTAEDADEVAVRFVKLVNQQRIEQAVTFESDDAAFAGVMRMTWTLEPVNEGTLVTVRAEDVPAGIRREEHEAGMKVTLDNLAAFVGRETR
jgi:uncharacterized protein YndB with AHSA1/START domain